MKMGYHRDTEVTQRSKLILSLTVAAAFEAARQQGKTREEKSSYSVLKPDAFT
jgi:hypothetical protein